MTPKAAAALLAVAAAFDNRKPDADQAKVWAIALAGLRFEDCRDAIVKHYQTTREWLMPADVIIGVRRIRNARVVAFGVLPDPPIGHDPDNTEAHLRYIAETTEAIADGRLTRTEPDDPAQVTAGRDVVGHLEQRTGHRLNTIPVESAKSRKEQLLEIVRIQQHEQQAAAKPEPEPLLAPEDHSRESQPQPEETPP